MSKWNTIYTNAMTPSNKNNRKIANFIDSISSKTLEELKEVGNASYTKEKARQDSLLEAYENNKLKSKTLIKEAQAIKKARAKAAEKTAKKQK